MHDFLITCGVTESPLDTSHAFECGTGLFFFISLNLWFSFAEDGGICVFTNMTAASNCERPSSTFKFPGCLTSEQLCLFAVPESWIAWLHYSSLRIIVYDTKPHPRYVPRKQCASPSPVHPCTVHDWWVHSRRPPVPLGWQKITSPSRWETLRRSSHFCLRDRWSHGKKGPGRSWKLPASLVIFSTYMTTCVHIHQLN